MNRFQQWIDEAENVNSATPQVQTNKLLLSQNSKLNYSIFTPLHFEPNYAYPLLVWLHGPGDDERQLNRVIPHVSLQNYVGIGPRGCSEPAEGCLGFQWSHSACGVSAAQQRVFESIEIASRRANIASDRIFLGGYECGGTMALQIGLQNPERFAGIISIGGPFPENPTPLLKLDAVRRLPLLLAQGRDSVQYPQEKACEELRLFHAASMRVMVRQYPCGDELTTQMLKDMNEWMMERITGEPVSDEQPYAVFPHDWN